MNFASTTVTDMITIATAVSTGTSTAALPWQERVSGVWPRTKVVGRLLRNDLSGDSRELAVPAAIILDGGKRG